MNNAYDVRGGNAHHMYHPMIDPKVVQAYPPLIVDRADGVYIFDIDGKRYLDTVASLWNVNVGHNRREVIDAIKAQLDKLAYTPLFKTPPTHQRLSCPCG